MASKKVRRNRTLMVIAVLGVATWGFVSCSTATPPTGEGGPFAPALAAPPHVEGLTQAATVAQPEIERRLLLLNDIPGVVARASFAPGASTGGADLVVTVAEDEPLTTTLEANNHGSATTGEYLLSASFHFKDLFGLGDSTRAKLVASHSWS